MKIQTKILLIIFSVILIAGIIIIIITKQISSNIIKEQVYNQLETTAKSRANHINTFLAKGKECIVQLSNSIVVRKLLKLKMCNKDYKQEFNDVMIRLKYSKIVFKDIYDVFILDRNGIIIASSNKSDIGKDKSSDSYFLGGKLGAFIKDVYFSHAIKKNCLAFSAPVFDKQNNKFLGVVVNRYSLEPLNIITQDRTGLGETGEIYLVNKDNYIITPSRFIDDTFLKYKIDTPESREWLKLSKQEEEIEREEIDIYTSYYGKEVIGTHYRIEGINWCLLTEISEKEAFAPAARLTQIMLLILVILLSMGIITSVFISRTFTAPIVKLHKGTEAIRRGNLNYRVGTKAKDEIGQLSRTFDKMTSNLKKTREELKEYSKSLEKKVKERTAELKKQFEKSEQQRIGTLNILRDLEQAHESLKAESVERKQAEEKYINQLKSMISLGISMRMELKLESLLQNICNMIVKSLAWRQVILSLRDYDAGTSRPVAMAGYDKKTVRETLSKPPVSLEGTNTFLRDEFKISCSYFVNHTNWEKMKKYPAEIIVTPVKDLKPGGWDEKDILLIPIQGKKNILGFISPDNPVDGKRPTKETVQPLEIFANQAAVAIENAQLYKELQRRLRELETFYKATMGREKRVIELKHQVNELLERLGKEKKYRV